MLSLGLRSEMQNHTSAFVDALRFGSYLAAARLTVYANGNTTAIILPIADAQFTVDRNSAVRRQGQITVEVLPTVPPQTVVSQGSTMTLLPLAPTSLLAPFGTEVFVEMTVMSGGQTAGANGWIPMGMYQIGSSTTQDSGNDMTVTLDLHDRSWGIAQRALIQPYTVPATSSKDLQSEIVNLVGTVWGSAPPWTYAIVPSSYQVPAGTYNQGQDPWQACVDMATAAGYELFFDVSGNLVGKPIPDPATQAVVWNFQEGEVAATGTTMHPLGGTPFTTPVATTIALTRDGIANDFFVAATGPNNATGGNSPVQAEAADNNASSPTWIGGPMGDVPNFIFDPLITTKAQALAEAQYNLQAALAKAFTLSVVTPPNPLFDIDDVCTITRSRLALSNAKFVVDNITTAVRYDLQTTLTGRFVPG